MFSGVRSLYYSVTSLPARFAGVTLGSDVWLSRPGKYRLHSNARVQLEADVWMAEYHRLEAHGEGQIILGRGVHCADNVRLTALAGAQIHVEEGCFFNHNVSIMAAQNITIGKNSIFGPFCYLTDLNHGIAKDVLVKTQPHTAQPISIGADVWVGVGVAILKGATIEDGAIIGAHSVVNKRVPAYEIWAGTPARCIGQRT